MTAGQEGTSVPQGPQPPYAPGRARREPARGRIGLAVALTAAAVAAASGATALVAAGAAGTPGGSAVEPAGFAAPAPVGPAATPPPSGGMRSMTVPDSVDGYRRQTGQVADRMAENLRQAMESAQKQYGAAYGKAKIGIYQRPGDTAHPLIFVGLPGRDIPQLAAELRSRPSSDEVDSVFMGMGIMDAKDYPAGPLGGVLRCGKGNTGGTATAAACVWADGSVVGLTMTPLAADVPGLARLSLSLRNAAEH